MLSASGIDTASTNYMIVTIRDTKLFVSGVTLSTKENQKRTNNLSKGFKRSMHFNEYKTKNENKDTTNNHRYFLESNFVEINELFVFIYLNRGNDIKIFKAPSYYQKL